MTLKLEISKRNLMQIPGILLLHTLYDYVINKLKMTSIKNLQKKLKVIIMLCQCILQ